MFANPRPTRSVATQVLVVQAVVAGLVVALWLVSAYLLANRQVERLTAAQVSEVALAIAATDDVREGLAAEDPAAALARFAERQRQATATDFVVVMSVTGVRYTHPNPDLVGEQYVGTIGPAQQGEMVIEDYTGSLGPSTRAVVPVLTDGEVVGLVSVGLTRTRTGELMREQIPQIAVSAMAAALLAGIGTLVVARRVRRQTLGLGARELTRLVDHHDAVLHAVQDGLVITDADGQIQVVNDEASRLLGLGADDVGRAIDQTGLPQTLTRMMTSHGHQADIPLAASGRLLLVSSGEVRRQGRVVGTLTTLRDRTELQELTGELGVTKSLADALHAQNHEAANRLHAVVTLVELGRLDEAVEFATEELRAGRLQREAILAAFEEPAVAALLLGKSAQAAEHGVLLTVDPDAHLPAGVLPGREVVLILGNLIDNAVDALAAGEVPGGEQVITVDAMCDPDRVVLAVADTGPGLAPEHAQQAFERGWTTKPSDEPVGRGVGLALVKQTVQALGGEVSVSAPPGAVFTVTIPRGGDA